MPSTTDLASWDRCPRCGASLEHEENAVLCPECSLTVYANPAPTVSAFPVDADGHVLLARRAVEPGAGRWDALGGFMEEDEGPLETLRREVEEETGVEIEPDEFVGGFPDRYGDGGVATINFYWTVRLPPDELVLSDEITEVRWFDPGSLPPPDEFAFPNTVAALRAWLAK